jgi:subfamily B ATP-binding cassette protein HlyB/CyaB
MAAEPSGAQSGSLDSGLRAFVSLLRFLGKPADAAQLKHQFAPDGEAFTSDHILRAAKRLEVKARLERISPQRLEKAALGALAMTPRRKSVGARAVRNARNLY